MSTRVADSQATLEARSWRLERSPWFSFSDFGHLGSDCVLLGGDGHDACNGGTEEGEDGSFNDGDGLE